MRKTKKIRLHNQILINIGTFLVLLLILFVIAEGVSRLAFKYTKEGPTAVNLEIFQESPTYVWGHMPGAIDYHGYENPTPEIRINKLGLRDDELLKSKPDNTKRILVLGDSFTFGMGVSHKNIYTEILERILNEKEDGLRYEVVNTGSIGYTTDNEFMLLKDKGLQLDPDMVIVGFFVGNDITEFRRHRWVTDDQDKLIKVIDTKHYVDEKNRLRYKGEEEPLSYFLNFIKIRWEILTKKIGIYGNMNNGPTLTWPAFLEPDDEHGDPNLPEYWNKVEEVFKQMKEMLDEHDVELVVVAIPMDVQTDKKFWNKYPEMYFDDEAYEKMRPQTKLKELTDAMGIDFIDLLPYFKDADPNEWYYHEKTDPHWTIIGNELAAQTIANNLEL
ncbi:hypothetical protein ACFLZH_05275 [Patescibacteria group bacterium]